MGKRRVWLWLALLTLVGGVLAPSASATDLPSVSGTPSATTALAAGADPVRACSTLAAVTFGDGSRVTSAAEVPANIATPAYCNVTVLVPDRVNINVLLPVTNWNGRYMAAGNGGYGGLIIPPTGALAYGYVTSATDTGHSGVVVNGDWAYSPIGENYQQIQDFAYRANHEMAVKSKALTSYYYGKAPVLSYWNGCSSGGREGLTEAMRYPTDFDGILAGAPAINWTKFIPAEEWPAVVMHLSGDYLPSCKEAAVTQAVQAACDANDGLVDGITDEIHCNFDPSTLLGRPTPCGEFTATDVAVLQKIFQGPRDANGKFLWYGLEPGADLGSIPGQTLAGTVSANGVAVDGVPFNISDDWFKYWLAKNPTFDWHSLTYDSYANYFAQSVNEWADDLATNSTNLAAFRDNGGKLLIWHGEADPLIFPQGTINYYDRLTADMGGAQKVTEFARLFLAPDVGHCGGGTGPQPVGAPANSIISGPDVPGLFQTLVDWREQGVAPARVLATLPPHTGANTRDTTMTRPLCVYPNVARYNGLGDTNSADSFTCAASY